MITQNQNMEKKRNYVIWIYSLHKNRRYGFIVYIKTESIYSNIEKYVETRFDTSNYELDKSLPKGKNKKVNRLTKHELGGKK